MTATLLRVDVATRYLAGARAAVAKYGKIEHWDVSCVTDMDYLFWDAAGFNADISKWQTGNVVTMQGMFEGATSFNAFIGGWNTASVTTMRGMFREAKAFDQPIGGWDTSSVTDMTYMFYVATSFDQPIGNWNTSSLKSCAHIAPAPCSGAARRYPASGYPANAFVLALVFLGMSSAF